jgi:Reverse transcriptase (RNA-dependent DNA polymerase)
MGMSIIAMIMQAFRTTQAPQDWTSCNIILIPKIEGPTIPKEYRPISIRNVLYSLLTKVITNRLMTHMGDIISINQSVFVKGRNIADNAILMREIIHSFNTPSYKEKEFALKANITKAFDTVEWPFVMECLYAINVPDKLIKLIKSLLQDSKLTMMVNG